MNVLMKFFIVSFISIYVFNTTDCAKILCLFSAPILTHNFVFRRLTHGLLQKGHELVVMTSFPEFSDNTVTNLTEIDVREISYQAWKTTAGGWADYIRKNVREQKESVQKIVTSVCLAQIQHPEIEKIINDENSHFDLIIIEIQAKPHYILSHIFKAPVILVSSMGESGKNYEIFGASVQPLLYPPFMAPKFTNNLFWEKIYVLYEYYWYQSICLSQENIINKLLKKHFGDDTPDINEISNYLDTIILNVHTTWEANRPVPLGIVFTGGLHIVPEKELPNDLKFFLDSSKNGIIYIGFGTNIVSSLFPLERFNILLNVFSELPYDVVFKWDQDQWPECPENVKIFKRLPQADVLRHPKIKLFVTHAGLLSIDEAITAGVPMVGIPMFGDHWFNAEKIEQHKIGLKLDFSTLTEENFKDAIEAVIGDENYRQNVVKLRSIMHDKQQSSVHHAVWWTEYVLRHGGGHLRSPGANLTWTEFYEVELVLILSSMLIVIISLCTFSMNLLYKICIKKFRNLMKIFLY